MNAGADHLDGWRGGPGRPGCHSCGGCRPDGRCRGSGGCGRAAPPPATAPNRPGLARIDYRVGTHASFLASMKARLSRLLPELHTRDAVDPAVAFLDAWAVVGDVLAFYQERIANEGYLRTATERRSVVELGNLVGYRPRPGVSASVYLAFTVEAGYRGQVPRGTRAQSLPVPGETPQPFETGADTDVRAAWNNLRPRLTRPQVLPVPPAGAGGAVDAAAPVYLDGTATGLRPNDLVLVDADGRDAEPWRVRAVRPEPALGRTVAEIEPWLLHRAAGNGQPPAAGPAPAPGAAPQRRPGFGGLGRLAAALAKPPSRPPTHPTQLPHDPSTTYSGGSDVLPRLLAAARPALGAVLYDAFRELPRVEPSQERFDALRVRARPFGHNAPPREREMFLVRFGSANDDVAIRVQLGPDAGISFQLPPADGRTTVPFPAADETLEVTLSGFGGEFGNPDIVVVFTRRRLTVEILGVDNLPRVTSTGGDPTTVELTEDAGDAGVAGRRGVEVSGEIQREPDLHEKPDAVSLDASYPQILPGSRVVVDRPDGDGRKLLLGTVREVREASRSDYGLAATGTQLVLDLDEDWLADGDTFAVLRDTTVYAHSEPLKLAEVPIDPVAEPVGGDAIELDGLYDGLMPGRWLVVAGERTDVTDALGDDPGQTAAAGQDEDPAQAADPGRVVRGLQAAELAMLAGVEHFAYPHLPGDSTHTVLRLANDLAYTYRRDSVTVYGNVVDATHGETRSEVLGSGDAGTPGQRFDLRHAPLTYVSAATPSGTQNTLVVRADDVAWHAVETLAEAGPLDRDYVIRTGDPAGPADDDGDGDGDDGDDGDGDAASVRFGDGVRGSRLPTGSENVTAEYRTGIGRSGNVGVGRISLLATRPLGVTAVTNPIPATGGADRDRREAARRNAPLGVMALDRLVSVRDYADFARTFAGIGKADAVRLSDGRRQVVHVTIAGVDDIPIDETSDLLANLLEALRRFGDPFQPVEVEVRELLTVVMAGQVRVAPTTAGSRSSRRSGRPFSTPSVSTAANSARTCRSARSSASSRQSPGSTTSTSTRSPRSPTPTCWQPSIATTASAASPSSSGSGRGPPGRYAPRPPPPGSRAASPGRRSWPSSPQRSPRPWASRSARHDGLGRHDRIG